MKIYIWVRYTQNIYELEMPSVVIIFGAGNVKEKSYIEKGNKIRTQSI